VSKISHIFCLWYLLRTRSYRFQYHTLRFSSRLLFSLRIKSVSVSRWLFDRVLNIKMRCKLLCNCGLKGNDNSRCLIYQALIIPNQPPRSNFADLFMLVILFAASSSNIILFINHLIIRWMVRFKISKSWVLINSSLLFFFVLVIIFNFRLIQYVIIGGWQVCGLHFGFWKALRSTYRNISRR